MHRLILAITSLAALGLAPPVLAKPAAPKGTQLTATDIRTCMGLDNSAPNEQITACTKIINSGKVKPPHTGDYYATRAAAYFATKQLDKAMADLNKAISFRQAPAFYLQRALLHMAARDFAKATADLEQVMKLKPDFAQVYLVRGVVSYQEADYAEALKYFNKAVELAPTHYKAVFARGVAKKKLGDDKSGDKDIADARGMSPKVDKDLEDFGIIP